MTTRLCLDQAQGKDWCLINGDSAEVLPTIPTHSIGLTVTSIPFQATYCYSPSARDLGNVSSGEQFWQHMAWVSRELLRVTMPGRHVCLHVANLPRYANRDESGESGRYDFRGDTIRHFESAGFVYHSEATVQKNPQRQAIANHSKGLLFVQLQRDGAAMWQAWADYLLVMRAPGKNPEPVKVDINEDTWIEWAAPVWWGIRETATLDGNAGLTVKGDDDDKHLCPLQLPFIERCVRLWSNRGDTVLDPFCGIGSTPYVAVKWGRKGLGIELNPSYWRQSVGYLREAERLANQPDLVSLLEAADASHDAARMAAARV